MDDQPTLSAKEASFYALSVLLITVLFQILPMSLGFAGFGSGWPFVFATEIGKMYHSHWLAWVTDLVIALLISLCVYLQCRRPNDSAIRTARVFATSAWVFIGVGLVLINADQDGITPLGVAAGLAWSLLLIRQCLAVGARPLLLLTGFSFFFATAIPNLSERNIMQLLLLPPISAGVILLLAEVTEIARGLVRPSRQAAISP